MIEGTYIQIEKPMTTNDKYKILQKELEKILNRLRIYSPHSALALEFDADGYWRVYHEHNEKTVRKYRKFLNAIKFLLENN